MNDLKPCPFCGGTDNVRESISRMMISCSHCGIAVKLWGIPPEGMKTMEDVWNRRVENGS